MPVIPKIVWRGKTSVVPIEISKAYCIVDCLGNSPLFEDRFKVRLQEVYKKDYFPGIAWILVMGPPVTPTGELPISGDDRWKINGPLQCSSHLPRPGYDMGHRWLRLCLGIPM